MPFTDGHGHSIEIEASDSFLPSPEADRALANVIFGLLHGPEMDGLYVFVLSTEERASVCGPDAIACYDPGVMVLDGEDLDSSSLNVVAHEYGHHVSANRLNPPFDGGAFDWGTKRWASYEQVCSGEASGQLGIRGERGYLSDPSEAFAEAYSFIDYPGRPWHWISSLQPNSTSLAAIRQDIESPWTAPIRSSHVRFFQTEKGKSTRPITIRTPLDGDILFQLRGARRSDFDMAVVGNDKVLAIADGPTSRETIGGVNCGVRSHRVIVRRISGSGRFTLTVTHP